MLLELWLDESGAFDDWQQVEPCSLVGGVLSQQPGLFTEQLAEQLLQHAYQKAGLKWDGQVHGTEIKRDSYAQYQILVKTILQDLSRQGLQPIIFENKQRIVVLDPDVTFLHVVADGITQLFEATDQPNQQLALNIVAARRMSGPEYNHSIPATNYMERITETMHLNWIRRGRYDQHKRWQINDFKIGSARTDFTLMIADLICNAWYRPGDRAAICSYYEPFVFSVLQYGPEQVISNLIGIGAIGQAVFELLACRSKGLLTHATDQLAYTQVYDCLINLPHLWRIRHLQLVTALIDSTIHMEHSLQLGCQMAQDLLALLHKLQEDTGQDLATTIFKCRRVLVSAFNHQGQVVAAEEVTHALRSMYKPMLSQLESVNEVCEAIIREAVHHTNCYGFEQAIAQMDRLIAALDEIAALVPYVLDETTDEPMTSELLGKAIGTRLQAYTFLARQQPHLYKQAELDSERALICFTLPEDLQRQALYRCQLECDRGQHAKALDWLLKAANASELAQLTLQLAQDDSVGSYFMLCHLARLMAAADSALANEINQLWVRYGLDEHPALFCIAHPTEITCWKRGTYYLKQKQIRAGLSWHQKALDICHANPDDLTLRSIGLGVLADQCSWLLSATNRNFKDSLQQLVRQTNTFLRQPNLPASMDEYFEPWPQTLAKIKDTPEVASLARLAWLIPY